MRVSRGLSLETRMVARFSDPPFILIGQTVTFDIRFRKLTPQPNREHAHSRDFPGHGAGFLQYLAPTPHTKRLKTRLGPF